MADTRERDAHRQEKARRGAGRPDRSQEARGRRYQGRPRPRRSERERRVRRGEGRGGARLRPPRGSGEHARAAPCSSTTAACRPTPSPSAHAVRASAIWNSTRRRTYTHRWALPRPTRRSCSSPGESPIGEALIGAPRRRRGRRQDAGRHAPAEGARHSPQINVSIPTGVPQIRQAGCFQLPYDEMRGALPHVRWNPQRGGG